MAETNPYAALEREKSSPSVTEQEVLATPVSGRTSEASPALRLKGDELEPIIPVRVPPPEQHAPATPSREPAAPSPAIQVNVGKAPGSITYAEAATEHKDAAGEAARASAAEATAAGEEAGRAAQEGAEYVHVRAEEAKEAVVEKAEGLTQAARERAGEAVEGVKEGAGCVGERPAEVAEDVKQGAAELRERAGAAVEQAKETVGPYVEAARERGAEAAEAAKEYAQAATAKAGEVASEAGEKVKSTVDYVKQHLPRVERAESTPEERQAKALLDEAMGLAEGTAGPLHFIPEEETATARAAAAAPTTPAGDAGASAAAAPPAAPVPELPRSEHPVLDTVAAIGSTTLEGGKEPDTVTLPSRGPAAMTSPTTAPAELAQRAEREDVSARRPLEAVADKVKETFEAIKEHFAQPPSPRGQPPAATRTAVPGGLVFHPTRPTAAAAAAGEPAPTAASGAAAATAAPGAPPSAPSDPLAAPGSPRGRVHEYRALPGDIHIPLLARAVREKVMHTEPVAPAERAQEAGGAVRDAAASATEEAKGAAAATKPKAEEAAGAVSEWAEEAAGGLVHSVTDAVHEVEEKVKWTVEHSKEKLHETAEQWQEEIKPHSLAEEMLARGEVPSNTEDILRARGQLPPVEAPADTLEPELAPTSSAPPPTASGAAGKPGLLERITPTLKEAGREALEALDRHTPGEEGEVQP